MLTNAINNITLICNAAAYLQPAANELQVNAPLAHA